MIRYTKDTSGFIGGHYSIKLTVSSGITGIILKKYVLVRNTVGYIVSLQGFGFQLFAFVPYS